MTLNASTNLPGGMTHADYNRLAGSKVEFIRVNELPTSYIKEYPTIYILMKDDSIGIMYEYNSSTNTWLKYGGDLGIIPITGEEYDNLSEEDKNKDVFYLITDRIAYLEDVSVMKGATAEADGTTGTVPVPKAGDQNKFLRGDGTWAYTPSSGGSAYDDTTPYTLITGEDGDTFTQNYDDGRQTVITKTQTGFNEVSKNSSGDVVSETVITMNEDGSIRSETTLYGDNSNPEQTPNGDTVELVNDVQTWLKCAEINDKDYTELSQVLADTTTLYTLVNDENAMKYLARSTDFSETLCNDETFMTYLGQSAYVDSTVLNSDIWVERIVNSEYMDMILVPIVPTMTSDTRPQGECSGFQIDRPAYYAFENRTTPYNGNWDGHWAGNGNTDFSSGRGYLQYYSPTPYKIKAYRIIGWNPTTNDINNFYYFPIDSSIEISTDGNNFHEVSKVDYLSTEEDVTHWYSNLNGRNPVFKSNSNEYANYFRILNEKTWIPSLEPKIDIGHTIGIITSIQFYGRK